MDVWYSTFVIYLLEEARTNRNFLSLNYQQNCPINVMLYVLICTNFIFTFNNAKSLLHFCERFNYGFNMNTLVFLLKEEIVYYDGRAQ